MNAAARCYGKLPVLKDKDTPTFTWLMDGARYVPPSATVDWYAKIKSWPMLGNDKISNCTIAAAQHAVQLWTGANNIEIIPDTFCSIASYAHATGYDPSTGANDNGAIELNILKYWARTGIAVNQNGQLNLLDGFAVINPVDIASIQRAVEVFGCVYAGVEMPISADTEFDQNLPWSDISGPSVNGHAIVIVGCDGQGFYCVTWGRLQFMTYSWWLKYGSESYALLRREWIGSRGVAPSGLTMPQLDYRISLMKGYIGLGAFG